MNLPNRTMAAAAIAAICLSLPAQDPRPEGETDVPGTEPGTAQASTPVVPMPAQLVTGQPNAWFDKTRLFIGEFLNEEKVKGRFNFENPTGKPVTWREFHGSCQCAGATFEVGERRFELSKDGGDVLDQIVLKDGKPEKVRVREITVQPGEKGTIDVYIEMGSLQGLKDATLSFATTDEAMRHVTLTWQAKGIKIFEVTPRDVFFNGMKFDDQKKFSFIVRSDVYEDFELLDHEPLPSYVTIDSKAQIELPDGKKAWKIEGTFGPNADPQAGGAALKFKTDKDGKEVLMNVIASVQGPFTIDPGSFIHFGKVRKGEGAERQIRITPNSDYDLKLLEVTFPKLTFDQKYISAQAERLGKDLVVTVKLSPEIGGALLLHGSMVLEMNHPALKSKMFNFNGILRP